MSVQPQSYALCFCLPGQVVGAANYLTRVAFGAALVTSVAVVWLAIIAILSSASSDRDDRWAMKNVLEA